MVFGSILYGSKDVFFVCDAEVQVFPIDLTDSFQIKLSCFLCHVFFLRSYSGEYQSRIGTMLAILVQLYFFSKG